MNTSQNNLVYLIVHGKGKLCFTFSGTPYNIKNENELQYMYITFNGNRCKDLFDRFEISPSNCIFKDYENLICFWQNSLEKANPRNIDLVSEIVLLYTFSSLSLVPMDSDNIMINDMLKILFCIPSHSFHHILVILVPLQIGHFRFHQ